MTQQPPTDPLWSRRSSTPPSGWGQQPTGWSRTPSGYGQSWQSPYGAPQQPWSAPAGWAQQSYGTPGMPTPPRRPRRRGGFFRTFFRVSVILFVVITGVSVMNALASWNDPADPTPTSTATKTTSASAPTTSASPGQVQNAGYTAPAPDYDPPEVPSPDTYSQADDWLKNNALYSQRVASPTNCAQQPISGSNTPDQLETKLNDEMACLMAVWEPPLKAAGYQLPRPPVTVYTSRVTTACGVMKDINAAYCAGDQHVYYSSKLLNALPSSVAKTKYAPETIIAHEFGHAVQARSGMLVSDKALEQKASKSDALVLSRRAEQQADCFGGLYVESVAASQGITASDMTALQSMNMQLGDDTLSGDPNANEGHGLGRDRQAWWTTGSQTTSIGSCNTWTVPASKVR